jgi:hypothetical protein
MKRLDVYNIWDTLRCEIWGLNPEDGGITDLRIGILSQHYTASQLRRSRLETAELLTVKTGGTYNYPVIR